MLRGRVVQIIRSKEKAKRHINDELLRVKEPSKFVSLIRKIALFSCFLNTHHQHV